ncbi:AMP-binding protein [Streptomyces sp. NPDC056452]|uniref:AMP-binding protein n=1 Tax=Streptomyces sp. NPDC056452 TaxID=3345821 RepID=UPI003676BBCC
MTKPDETVPRDGEGAGLLGWFLRGLALSPDGVALRVGRAVRTYRELDLSARTVAGELLDRSPGTTRVGVLAHHSEQAYSGFLAGLYAGAAVVPLQPDFPAERLRAMISAAAVTALVVDDAGAERLDELAEVLDGIAVVEAATGAASPVAGPPPAVADRPAYIMFTSGSTGRPKGVPISHANIGHYLSVVHEQFGFTADDVFSQANSLTFDLALFDMFAAWGCGGTLVAVPAGAYVRLADFITRHRLTVWFSAPSVIATARRTGSLKGGALPTLRRSLFCGEPLMVDDAEAWLEAADLSALHNLYGPTELTVSCATHTWDPAASRAAAVNGIVPIGRLHAGLRHVLFAPDGGPPETGELCVSGPQMLGGYLDPADDEGRFLHVDGERWYRTGDVVRRLPDGEFCYLRRDDQQVNIGGVRIELREVEYALRRCTGVDGAVVLAVDGVLLAYVTGGGDPAPLREQLVGILPKALIPRRIERVEALPLNGNGKIDRRALTERAAQNA